MLCQIYPRPQFLQQQAAEEQKQRAKGEKYEGIYDLMGIWWHFALC